MSADTSVCVCLGVDRWAEMSQSDNIVQPQSEEPVATRRHKRTHAEALWENTNQEEGSSQTDGRPPTELLGL